MTLKELRFLADVSDGVAVKVRVPTGDFLKLIAVAEAARKVVSFVEGVKHDEADELYDALNALGAIND